MFYLSGDLTVGLIAMSLSVSTHIAEYEIYMSSRVPSHSRFCVDLLQAKRVIQPSMGPHSPSHGPTNAPP